MCVKGMQLFAVNESAVAAVQIGNVQTVTAAINDRMDARNAMFGGVEGR